MHYDWHMNFLFYDVPESDPSVRPDPLIWLIFICSRSHWTIRRWSRDLARSFGICNECEGQPQAQRGAGKTAHFSSTPGPVSQHLKFISGAFAPLWGVQHVVTLPDTWQGAVSHWPLLNPNENRRVLTIWEVVFRIMEWIQWGIRTVGRTVTWLLGWWGRVVLRWQVRSAWFEIQSDVSYVFLRSFQNQRLAGGGNREQEIRVSGYWSANEGRNINMRSRRGDVKIYMAPGEVLQLNSLCFIMADRRATTWC